MTTADLEKSTTWRLAKEAARRADKARKPSPSPSCQRPGLGKCRLGIHRQARRESVFDSNTEPYDVTGALALTKDRLHVAFRTGKKDLLKNTNEPPTLLQRRRLPRSHARHQSQGRPKSPRPRAGRPPPPRYPQTRRKTTSLLYRPVVPAPGSQ